MEYLRRVADEQLKERLNAFGAVLIEGPKWCGKTTTAQQAAASVIKLRAENSVMGNLHNAYLEATDRYADSIRLYPEQKIQYEVKFEEYLRIKKDAQRCNPSYHQLIERDMIDHYTSYINQLEAL